MHFYHQLFHKSPIDGVDGASMVSIEIALGVRDSTSFIHKTDLNGLNNFDHPLLSLLKLPLPRLGVVGWGMLIKLNSHPDEDRLCWRWVICEGTAMGSDRIHVERKSSFTPTFLLIHSVPS